MIKSTIESLIVEKDNDGIWYANLKVKVTDKFIIECWQNGINCLAGLKVEDCAQLYKDNDLLQNDNQA